MTTKYSYKLLAIVEADRITGPAKNLLEFARLARHGNDFGLPNIEVTFVTYCRATPHLNPFTEAAEAAGIRVEVIDESYRFDLKVIPQLYRISEKIAPDIIQTHSVKSHFLFALSGLKRRYKWVAFHHGYTATDWKVRAYNYLDRWTLCQPERVVTMNKLFANELRGQGVAQDRISVLHNSINADWLGNFDANATKALKIGLRITSNEKMILTVGRLSHEKGMNDLVEAVWHLRKARPDIKAKFVIVGDGPEKANLISLAARRQISSAFIFTGQELDVRPYFAAADLFLLPSHTEGSPNALLEAMTAQLPIAATKVGGVPEIMTDREHGLLVVPHNPSALANSICELIDHPEFAAQLAMNARSKIIHQYSPEARVRKLVEMYSQILFEYSAPQTESNFALEGLVKK
jgi:glycosyltransferase involved in cell wall biosynthesis